MQTYQALMLLSRLREEMSHDIFFAQACLNAADEDVAALNRIIALSRSLRSNKLAPNERAAHEHIKHVQRSMMGQNKQTLRRETRRRLKVGTSTLIGGKISDVTQRRS